MAHSNATPSYWDILTNTGKSTAGGYHGDLTVREMVDMGQLLTRDVFGRVVPDLAGEAYDHVGGLLKDTLRPEQQSGKFTGTAPISMPIKVDENGVVDTYKYDEDMSAPPEYNNAVPMVVNRNRV